MCTSHVILVHYTNYSPHKRRKCRGCQTAVCMHCFHTHKPEKHWVQGANGGGMACLHHVACSTQESRRLYQSKHGCSPTAGDTTHDTELPPLLHSLSPHTHARLGRKNVCILPPSWSSLLLHRGWLVYPCIFYLEWCCAYCMCKCVL